MPEDGRQVREVIGVYDADGTIWGEVSYVARKLTGRAHCALCDITHAGLRQRKEFAALAAQLGVPFELLHRDERPPDVLAETGNRAPVVLVRTDDGVETLLDPKDLERCDTSPARLFEAIRAAVTARGLRLG